MQNVLLTGPAGAGKTQEARAMLRAAAGPMVAADFQSILVALTLLERLPSGRYAERVESQASWLLPMTEAVRQTVITFATERDIGLVATSSDGSPARRGYLLSRLGAGARELVVDPGIDVVTARLSGPDGVLSEQCSQAIQRFYGRR